MAHSPTVVAAAELKAIRAAGAQFVTLKRQEARDLSDDIPKTDYEQLTSALSEALWTAAVDGVGYIIIKIRG
jgi:hypothetical protein